MLSEKDRQRIYELRCIEGLAWDDIAPLYPDTPRPSLRRIASTLSRRLQGEPKPDVDGVTARDEADIDEDEVWRKALRLSEKRKQRETRKSQQSIRFSAGPVCIVNFGDIHAGNTGVDYSRIDYELDIVLNTPGMFAGFAGDLLDNFIIGRLLRIRTGTEFTIDEEWILVKRVLRKAAPKMLWSVGGNHDKWTYLLAGIDYFRDVHRQIAENVLFDRDEIMVAVTVDDYPYLWRIRHKWRGHSQYNETHAVEKAAKFDKGKKFDVGVMAHTHRSGLARPFNNGGRTGVAVICGAYKRYDTFAKTVGFPQPNEQCAVAVILNENGDFILPTSLEAAKDYMEKMYQ